MTISEICRLVFGARKHTPSRVYIFRSYRENRSAPINNTSVSVPLVNVCRIAMTNSKHREYVNACLEALRPAEQMVGAVAKTANLTRLVADEVQLAHHETGSLRYLLEIGSQPKRSPSAWRSCWPFNKAQSDSKGLDIKSTANLEDFEHFRIGSLDELTGYVRGKPAARAEEYCSAQGLYDKLESCARVLVESRRSRASTIQWEIFAFSDRYLCSLCRKEGHDIGILDKPAFLDHVDSVHDFYDLEPPEMFKIQKESSVEL
jgi:hypothetical protein